MSAEVVETDKARKFTHVPFDESDCPVPGCTSLKGGPQHGAVPGIKRHVRMVHGKDVYDSTEFPPLRSPSGPMAQLPKETLQQAAAERKVKGAEDMSKTELLDALASLT